MRDPSTRSAFSSTGDWIDLAAPGSAIMSTRPAGTFGFASGTSMAAPLVAGAVALLRSADPGLDAPGVRDLLRVHARDVGAAGWDEEFRAGALDVTSALQDEHPPPPAIPDPAAGAAAGTEQPVAAPITVPDTEVPPLTRIPGLFTPQHYTRSH